MSENSFKVRAKKDPVKGPEGKVVTDRPQKPAKTSKGTGGAASSTKTARSSGSPTGVKRTSQGQASREKLRRARVTGSASGRMPDRSLPDVPDMGNMRSEERIGKVLGIEKNSKSVNRKNEVPKSDRYSSMKKQIQKNRSTAVKPTPARAKVRAKDDWALFVIRIACALILAILIAIVVLVTTRAVPEASEPPVQATSDMSELHGSASPVASMVTIDSGMGAREVAGLFSDHVDPASLVAFLEGEGLSSSIQVGTYALSPGMDVAQIAAMITERRSDAISIWPGYTIEDMDRMLANRSLAPSGAFIEAAQELEREYGLPFTEGWLLAGTYVFSSPYALAHDMLAAMLGLLKSMGDEVMASGLSLDQIVTIASMVNRETQDAAQMPVISAVILNRLEAGMPLGIDATTRYELDDWQNAIPQSTYELDTPYNTRRRPGLPPSGIGCPSPQAVVSVLQPADTQALYYLHDEDGKLYTSYTYEEHLDTYEQVH